MVALNETFNEGLLEVYAGPMRSGKSLRLIQRLDRLDYSGVKHALFKPNTDNRDRQKLYSRAMTKSYECNLIEPSKHYEMLNLISDERVVAIDEIQFFGVDVWDSIEKLLKQNVNVVVAGLDTDFRGEPFGATPYLLAQADIVYKLHAFCEHKSQGIMCGRPALMTQRLENDLPANYNSTIILPGDVKEGYEPRCRKHHSLIDRPSSIIDRL